MSLPNCFEQRTDTHHRSSANQRIRRTLLTVLGILACCCQTGCMYRRIAIKTDPPDALVMLDGEEVGRTPFSKDFLYYGTRELTLIKDGYETLTVMQKVPTPWYQWVPLDFFTDNLMPFRVTNRHEFRYSLQPQKVVSQHELLERANALRAETQVSP